MTDPAIVGNLPAPKSRPAKEPVCDPEHAYPELTPVFQRLQAARERRLFVFVELNANGITYDTLEEVCRWKTELRSAANAGPLDILLHSPGGGLTVCYQIARLLSRQVDEWEALVPRIAASGATLISLGSSNIVMGDMAILGPIDPQVISKRKEKIFAGERQSPLEAFEAITYLREYALTSMLANMYFLLEARIAPRPAMEHASNFALEMVKPIISKIEPYDLGAFALDSRLSREYCQRIAAPENAKKKTQRGVKVRHLVEAYAAHEFTVDIEEARQLGFKVSEPSDTVADLFDEVRTKLDTTETERYIGLVPETKSA